MKIEPISKPIKYCVLIPTFNNEKTLLSVIEGVAHYTSDIIIINDGATDQTSALLDQITQYEIISHEVNIGKGMALRNGFSRAIELGFEYAITIDSDGQHSPDDLPKMLEAINENPGKLIMGSRNMNQEGIPSKSSFGNRFSSFWFWAETSIRLSDTQTGYRAYPLAPLKNKKWYTERFEFEIEVIVRLAWDNVKFCEQPIGVTYEDDRVSHFRPLKDFMRISILNTVLFTLALLYYLPRLAIINFSYKNVVAQVKGEFEKNRDSPMQMAGSVGLGLFFGIFPIWGFQMVVAYAVASILNLNRIVVLFSSNISIPPAIPIIVYVSLLVGSFFVPTEGTLLVVEKFDLETAAFHLQQYIIGSSLLALFMGLLGTLVTYGLVLVSRRR